MCALRLLAMDASLGGIVVRARSGPVRDRFLVDMTRMIGPAHRLHPATSDEALFGGLDVSATLAHGAMVQQNGLLDRGGTLMLTMAERCPAGLAAKLAMALDSGRIARLVILDEGAETDETAPPGLAERVAFFVDLNDVALADIIAPQTPVNNTAAKHTTENLHQITDIAQQLGIDSLRAPMFALRAARVHAAMLGRAAVTSDDIEAACLLTLTHKATQFPQETEDAPAQDPSAKETPDQPQDQQMPDLPDDMLLDAVRAMLPDDLLDRIAAQKARRGKGTACASLRAARPCQPHRVSGHCGRAFATAHALTRANKTPPCQPAGRRRHTACGRVARRPAASDASPSQRAHANGRAAYRWARKYRIRWCRRP